jgi:hypothetical protein
LVETSIDDGVEARFPLFDESNRLSHHLDRRYVPPGDLGGEVGCAAIGDVRAFHDLSCLE